MKLGKPYKWLLVFVLVAAAVAILFFFRMYYGDLRALKGFMASYDRFDRSMSVVDDGGGTGALNQAGEALIELQTKASLRLSSLIKNDAALMAQAREIAELSGTEFQVAKEDGLHEGFQTLHEKRLAAYARFRELGGVH
jgi:hypothetical protein